MTTADGMDEQDLSAGGNGGGSKISSLSENYSLILAFREEVVIFTFCDMSLFGSVLWLTKIRRKRAYSP